MTIHFQGQMDQKLIRRALYRISLRLVATGAFAVLVSIIFLMMQGAASSSSLVIVGPVFLWGGFLLLLPMFRARSIAKTDALLFEPVQGEADDIGLRMRSESWNVQLKWDQIHRAKLTKEFAFLWMNAHSVRIVPRRYFASPDEWTQFRSYPMRKVPKRMHPMLKSALIWLGLVALISLYVSLRH